MSSWFVAVTAGRWQRYGIQQARELGFKIIAIDTDPNAEGLRDADHIINKPLSDVDGIIEELASLEGDIKGAVSFVSDAGVMLAAVIRDRFNLPGERPEVCGRMVNKAIQRSLWKHNGVPSPNFCVVTTKEGALSKIESFGFPLIIKPSDSSGSRGVTKLESASDDIGDAISRAFQFTRTSQVLIESFMEGNEFTVESFLADGKHYLLAITEKKKVEGTRGTVASELATPERPPEVLQRISQAVISAYDALQYRNGPGHAEVILMHDGSVGLVEVAGRGGGFLVFDKLIPAVSGINIARITAMQAVGIKLGTIDPISRSAVLRFFPSRHGILTGMQGFDSANLLEGVEAGPFASLGDRFSQATVDGDRLGYILSQGDTPSLAQLRADTAESLISFEISP